MAFDESFYMRLAIKKARQGIGEGQAPFACCIVRDGSILGCEHNKVWKRLDITAHAEIVAIREACRKIRAISLEGAILYSTCEPCPMCLAAAHQAKVSRIVFGCSHQEAAALGFSEMKTSGNLKKAIGDGGLEIVENFLNEETKILLEQYKEISPGKVY